MISTHFDSEAGTAEIVVRANKSMSWRANVLFAAALAGFSAIFGAVIATQGFWMVLPFAGLEFLLVYWALAVTYKRLGYMEVISKKGDQLLIESGYDQPVNRSEMVCGWIQVQFDDPPSPFDTGSLQLQCSGETVEIGLALNKEEKRMLYKEVLRCLQFGAPKLRLVN